MFSTAAQLRCDAVAYEPTRLRARERGTNQYGLGSVNNFSSYTSDGFEVYDVPDPPSDLVAVSPPLLASAAILNFSSPADNNDRITWYEIAWYNTLPGRAAAGRGRCATPRAAATSTTTIPLSATAAASCCGVACAHRLEMPVFRLVTLK